MLSVLIQRIASSFIIIVLLQCAHAALPTNYQMLTAQEKQAILWDAIVSTEWTTLPTMHGHSLSAIVDRFMEKATTLLFSLAPTFDHMSDELPLGRQKVIHTYGVVAKVRYVPASPTYFTGVYTTGAVGLVRLSLATEPSDSSYIPGMALKFFITGKPSVNLHLMNALEGQGRNWNFFAHTLSNRIGHPNHWGLRLVEKLFELTRSPANDLPTKQLAEIDPSGEYIALPLYPDQLFFKPTQSVQQLTHPNDRTDFRQSLSAVPVGDLYHIYGRYAGKTFLLGTLILESPFVASQYGDEVLFFQHHR